MIIISNRHIPWLLRTLIIIVTHINMNMIQEARAWEVLHIHAKTPSSVTDGTTINTIAGVAGTSVASSLLDPGTVVMFWGLIPSPSIVAACRQLVEGAQTLNAYVEHNWGDGPYNLSLQVIATGGCLASAGGEGTEMVFVDHNDRKSAVVCMEGAARDGCALFVTGDDVDQMYHTAGTTRRHLLALTACQKSGVLGSVGGIAWMLTYRLEVNEFCVGVAYAEGAIVATFVGLPGFLIASILCVAGVVAVSATIGADVGCSVAFVKTQIGCFPGHASVQLQGGVQVPMVDLRLGDKVAVWREGHVEYDDVYAFGHRDASAESSFYSITVFSELESRTLVVSAMHFLPTGPLEVGLRYKRARDVQVGDYVWAAQLNSTYHRIILPYLVKRVSITKDVGLFNPFTMTGTILVDGIVASVHSEWFLDQVFDVMGISHALPAAYQLVLGPARAAYNILGKDRYVWLYNCIRHHLQFEKPGLPKMI